MGKVAEEKTQRNKNIYYKRMAGKRLKDLANEYDLSRSRVYKIVVQYSKKVSNIN